MNAFFVAMILCASPQPELLWSFHAQSNLYAPGLAADVCGTPGKESIVSDCDARRLRCIDARGNQVWEYDGHWKRRLTSGAALSATARAGKGTLVVGSPDGQLCCVDAETGAELWRYEAGAIEWGNALWADINGDGRDEIVAGTEKAIVALDTEGNVLWTYKGKSAEKPIRVICPIAAADIDGDGKAEVFGADHYGPFCLGGDGSLRWETPTGDDFKSAVVVADADGDGKAEVYCCSANDNAVWCFDAAAGGMKWRVPMAGLTDTYPGSGMAVADIDEDGKDEILVADMSGHVHCINSDGVVRWVFATSKRVHAAATAGDVDGDGAIEVLVASGDHFLYCLNADGVEKWRYAADLRLISPPTIDDIDGNGETDILVCGSDKQLRCLTLHGKYDARLVPWGVRGFDVAQTASAFHKRQPREYVTEIENLFLDGGFEVAKTDIGSADYPGESSMAGLRKNLPRGWMIEGAAPAALEVDKEQKIEGVQSLRVTASDKPVTVCTELLPLPQGARRVTANVSCRSATGARACIRWRGLRGMISESALESCASAGNWREWKVDVAAPTDAQWVQLVLVTDMGESTWWDGANLTVAVRKPCTVQVMVNQVGYDAGAPYRFTVQSNYVAQTAKFELVAADGSTAFTSALKHEGRITGAYGNDWGYEYWRGDFSGFDTAGTFCIRATLDGVVETSYPFEIGQDVVWQKTFGPACKFFYYQRCGADVPGYHKACHLDDSISVDGKRQYELWGGWHDAGDYNKYQNAPYVNRLATSYAACRTLTRVEPLDGFFDEIVWGGDHVRRMMAPDGSAYGGITSGYGFWGPPEIETDNVPNTGDERPITGPETGNDSAEHTAAMAKIARYASSKEAWVEAAARGLAFALKNNRRGPLQFAAAMDLYLATSDPKYAALAKELAGTADVSVVYAVRDYDQAFGEHRLDALKEAIIKRADELLPLAQNPFGVYTFGPKEKPNFFNTPKEGTGWHVGTSSHILEAAAAAALALQFSHDPKYLEFAYDQLNWTLGNNPYNISLVEGCGTAFPPSYHHRYRFSGVARGAVPGSVVNGITSRGPRDDTPEFDMRGLDIPAFESNEVWLPHNTAYIGALVNLRVATERK